MHDPQREPTTDEMIRGLHEKVDLLRRDTRIIAAVVILVVVILFRNFGWS